MSGNVHPTVDPVVQEYIPTRPENIKTPEDIHYHVITKSTVDEKLSENPVYIALTWEDYLRLSQFEREKISYVEKLHLVIDYYERRLSSSKD